MVNKLREEVAIQLAKARNITKEEGLKILEILDNTYCAQILIENEIFRKRAEKFAVALAKIGNSDNLDDVRIALSALEEAKSNAALE